MSAVFTFSTEVDENNGGDLGGLSVLRSLNDQLQGLRLPVLTNLDLDLPCWSPLLSISDNTQYAPLFFESWTVSDGCGLSVRDFLPRVSFGSSIRKLDVKLNWYMEGIHLDHLVRFLALFPELTDLSVVFDGVPSTFYDATTQAPTIQLPHIRNLVVQCDYGMYPKFLNALATLCGAPNLEALSMTLVPWDDAALVKAISSFLSHGKSFSAIKTLRIKVDVELYVPEGFKPLLLILDKYERREDLANADPGMFTRVSSIQQSSQLDLLPFIGNEDYVRADLATNILHLLEEQDALKAFSTFRSTALGGVEKEKIIDDILKAHGIAWVE